MEIATPPNPLARAEVLLRLGIAEPAEVDDVVRTVAAFCGGPVDLALAGDGGRVPAAEALLARGRPAGETWAALGAGAQGRWLQEPGGEAWGLLCVAGPPEGARREGLEGAALLLEGMVARARARRERRGAGRGPGTSSFVPGLVHELRNAAFGFSAILDAFEERYGDRDEAHRYGGALRSNLEQLTGFIEELGAYGDPRSAPREPLALDLLLREAASLCQAQGERLGLAVRVVWEGPQVRVQADAGGLRDAFVALLRWALGQGGGGPVLLCAAGRAGGTAAAGHLEGPGLQAAGLDLARVFEPFYFRAAGMGRLALPVARRILEAHGGTLAAAPGTGGFLRLTFSLPCL